MSMNVKEMKKINKEQIVENFRVEDFLWQTMTKKLPLAVAISILMMVTGVMLLGLAKYERAG